MKKSILISLICIFAVLAMGILSAGAEAVRVAINPDSKPFKYFDENDVFSGIDADVINGIAEIQGLEIEFVVMDFDKIIDAVASCEVDAAISALTLTENRSAVVSFTDPYIMGLQSTFVTLNHDGWKDISDPEVKTIGAKAGTTAEETGKILAGMNDCELKTFAGYAELFEALEKGVIDAAIADELLAKEFVDTYKDMMTLGQPLSTEPYAIAVCPSNTELVSVLNQGLNELRRTGRLDEIVLTNLSGK
ncbi:MAG: amino acid ABC transporter substrate-binding protein [Anaerolineaceae bacterium]|nr:amino acid ABC transporter substrate-binding protein [Anaerolineaceae bacterium]